jgi:thioredoxin-dependent peroxiredoxin
MSSRGCIVWSAGYDQRLRRLFVRHTLILATLMVFSAPATAALAPGAKVPLLKTTAALAGKTQPFDLQKALRKGPVVLYFYPAAFTQGCTLEAHEFAEQHDAFAKAGATVVGMSNDDMPTLIKFSREACRDKFAVAQASPQAISAFDVKLGTSPKSNRTSYVIAPNGTVAYAYASMDYRLHVKNTLAAVQNMNRGK